MHLLTRGVLLFTLLIAAGCSTTQSPPQTTFSTPESAFDSLVSAMRDGSTETISSILGPDGQSLLDSGDEVQDRLARADFVQRYDQRHDTAANEDGSVTLIVGDNQWPMPIPVVREGDGWRFDTAQGAEELINRRVGRNELSAIEVCRAIVDAQREYFEMKLGGEPSFATKFISDEAKKNGLFWKTGEGEPLSPLGALAAEASEDGYKYTGEPQPYYGYYYRMLTAQGPSALGGEQNYMKNGKLTGGFAVLAWPANYGQSGVMTFTVNHRGLVYQRDLGEDTEEVVKKIDSFDPDASWSLCEE